MIYLMNRLALLAFAVIVLSACEGGLGPVTSMQSASHSVVAASSSYAVLHAFTDQGGDGFHPRSRLTAFNGVLYGTTSSHYNSAKNAYQGGTVFSITTSGKETVLYGFKGGGNELPPGPSTSLAVINGTLYGATDGIPGTLFSMTPSGQKKIFHTFDPLDCNEPTGDLIAVHGVLYATCDYGGTGVGSSSYGTVVSITTAGVVHVLHEFEGGPADGATPVGGLIYYDGALYGTTRYGGRANCHGRYQSGEGCGTVFRMGLDGRTRILYRFIGSSTGVHPLGGLAVLNGTLYGTTSGGGDAMGGTVFSLTARGKETVIHSFDRITDGYAPFAGLLAYHGLLYGTTNGYSQPNFGKIFSISPTGAEQVLHSFQGGSDGIGPYAPLIAYNGIFYGTTFNGGSSNCDGLGCGTVFRVAP